MSTYLNRVISCRSMMHMKPILSLACHLYAMEPNVHMSRYVRTQLLRTEPKQPWTLKRSIREQEILAIYCSTWFMNVKVLLLFRYRIVSAYKEKRESLSPTLHRGGLENKGDTSSTLDLKLMTWKDAKFFLNQESIDSKFTSNMDFNNIQTRSCSAKYGQNTKF